MNELLQQLLTMGPALGAGVSGNGANMQAFMEGYQRTQAQMQQQARLKQQDQFATEDRQRLIERQTLSDQHAASDRARAGQVNAQTDALRSLQVPGALAEVGGGAETPEAAQALIESLMPKMMAAFGPEAMAFGQPAVEQAQKVITGRQKAEVKTYLKEALESQHVAANPDSDPEIQLTPRMQTIVGKPSMRLTELQAFAEMAPVGKPQGKTRVPAMGGSQEDFIQRKYGDNPTPEQIIEGRKLYTDAGREPNAGGSGGLNPYQDAQFTERLAKTWNDANTSGREMRRQLGLMETGLKRFREGDKNGGSQAVLVTFQKILDPTSVVRESEYARSAAGISMIARMEGYIDRLRSGGAGVPDSELNAMVETARQMLAGMQGHANTQRSRIEAQAKKHKIDPVLIFGVEQPDAPAAPADAAQTSGPKAGERRKSPNGDLVEWDGKGWKLVRM